MKALLLIGLAACVALLCSPKHANGGRLSIYSDAALSDCTLLDASPGVVHIYVADFGAEATGGSIMARFRIAASAGFTGVWLSDTTPYVHIGNSQSDFGVVYDSCKIGQFLVLDMTYQLFGNSTCSTLSIAGSLGPVPLCEECCCFADYPCYPLDPLNVNCPGPFNCGPVATEQTTWGKVKALYRN